MEGGLESGMQLRAEKAEKLFLSSSIICKAVPGACESAGEVVQPCEQGSYCPRAFSLPWSVSPFPLSHRGPAQHHCWVLLPSLSLLRWSVLPTQSCSWYSQQEKLPPLTTPL